MTTGTQESRKQTWHDHSLSEYQTHSGNPRLNTRKYIQRVITYAYASITRKVHVYAQCVRVILHIQNARFSYRVYFLIFTRVLFIICAVRCRVGKFIRTHTHVVCVCVCSCTLQWTRRVFLCFVGLDSETMATHNAHVHDVAV